MKHGYFVMGKEDGQEFSYGKCESKRQVMKDYAWHMASVNTSDEVKKTLRIVEMVEKDITKEYYE